ncbi:MAG: penicillin acylase family protein, partial [Planctomycetales bacterium]
SNAWAISPSRSATGSALLACDPHLEVNRLPAIWYEASLRWPGDYVVGATLPGCPLFGVGRTSRLSWGVTYLKGDTTDYFVEQCRQGSQGGWQYRRGHTWHDFSVREETIQRKDNDPLVLQIYHNDVGMLESSPDTHGEGFYLSVAWAGSGEGSGRSIGTWLELIECESVSEAMDLVRENPQPTLDWVFADRDGHIGKQASGWMPRRAVGHNGLIPVPAWDRQNHWKGWQPSSVLPSEYDPPRGFVATANEDINRPNGPLLVTMPIPAYRRRRIDERLGELDQATIQDMQELQYDVVSLQARDLLQVFLPHLPDGEIKQRLDRWHGNYSPESYEASLFQRLYRNILLEIFGQPREEQGGMGWRRMLYLVSRIGYSTMVLTAIDRLLQKEESSWWRHRSKGDLIRTAAQRLDENEERPWSEVNAFRFTNRFFEGHLVGRLLGFHTAEMAMPGTHATVFQGHLLRSATRESTFAPSYHFVTDMDQDEIWSNLPGGPSESRFSKFYKNGIEQWANGQYNRLAPNDTDIA